MTSHYDYKFICELKMLKLWKIFLYMHFILIYFCFFKLKLINVKYQY